MLDLYVRPFFRGDRRQDAIPNVERARIYLLSPYMQPMSARDMSQPSCYTTMYTPAQLGTELASAGSLSVAVVHP